MTDTESAFSKPSLRVLEAVADADGAAPTALEPPLNDVVDPAALDRLFEPTATDGSARIERVSFRYRGYDVTIAADGSVELA